MLKGQMINFTAQKTATINGTKFKKDDMIEVTLERDVDENEGIGNGGSWGWGGYTTQFVKSIANKIKDAGNNNIIFAKRR